MWRFVHLSDPHFAALSDGCGNNLLIHSLMPEVASCLRRDFRNRKLEFILATGDLAASQSRDAVYAARDMLDSLGVPVYPLGGNQDFVLPRSRAWFVEAYHTHLPVADTIYSFTHRNLHICTLDPWWVWDDGALFPHRESSGGPFRWAVPPYQFDWLREDLAAHAGVPTVVAIHFPAVPLPTRLHRPRMLEPGHLANGATLVEFLSEFPQVIALFAGHAHMHYVVQNGCLTHVVTGALSEYPVEYREVAVYEDRLEIITCQLSDKSFAARSLVQENTWTAGQSADRSVVIPFKRR